jgi:hypothetical protein
MYGYEFKLVIEWKNAVVECAEYCRIKMTENQYEQRERY